MHHRNSVILREENVETETVWMIQKQIAELFGTKRPAITKHLKNIYASEELEEDSQRIKLGGWGREVIEDS